MAGPGSVQPPSSRRLSTRNRSARRSAPGGTGRRLCSSAVTASAVAAGLAESSPSRRGQSPSGRWAVASRATSRASSGDSRPSSGAISAAG